MTSFKVSDLHCFSIGQVQGFLYPLGFVVLQIQNDLGLGVVDDALTKSAAVKVKEIGKILACKNRGAAVTAYGFGNFFCTVGFGSVPNKVQRHKHTYGEQISREGGNIQNSVLVVEPNIGLLIEGAGASVYQTV